MMRKTLLGFGVLALFLALAVPATAQEDASWIHVRVLEDDGAKVKVNLPLSLVEVALEMVEEEAWTDRHVHIGHHSEFDVDDLRRMWVEVKRTGEAQFVDIEDDNERVRVYNRGDRVMIEVEDLEMSRQEIRVEVPFSIVDILLEGEGDELNVQGAIRELARVGSAGDLVTVNDGKTSVRVWIDNNANGEN